MLVLQISRCDAPDGPWDQENVPSRPADAAAQGSCPAEHCLNQSVHRVSVAVRKRHPLSSLQLARGARTCGWWRDRLYASIRIFNDWHRRSAIRVMAAAAGTAIPRVTPKHRIVAGKKAVTAGARAIHRAAMTMTTAIAPAAATRRR